MGAWVQTATVGAKAGTDIKDSGGNVLNNEDIRNSDLSISYSGTNIQLKKGSSQIGSNVDAPAALKNAGITVNGSGVLTGIGTANIVVNNSDLGSSDITGGLGFTPYNATNPSNFNNFTLPTNVFLGTPSISGTTISFPRNGAGTVNLTTQDTNTVYTSLNAVESGTGTKLAGITAGADVTGSNTAADTTAVSGTAAATVKNGAAAGATANQTSTADIRNGVTTFERSGGDIFWSNLNGNFTPATNPYDVTITWRNGSGSSLGTTIIRLTRTASSLAQASAPGNTASATINLGGAKSSGVLQTTTVTKNSVVCTIIAQIIDGSGWDFKG